MKLLKNYGKSEMVSEIYIHLDLLITASLCTLDLIHHSRIYIAFILSIALDIS